VVALLSCLSSLLPCNVTLLPSRSVELGTSENDHVMGLQTHQSGQQLLLALAAVSNIAWHACGSACRPPSQLPFVSEHYNVSFCDAGAALWLGTSTCAYSICCRGSYCLSAQSAQQGRYAAAHL
jgi:hypothetical protein